MNSPLQSTCGSAEATTKTTAGHARQQRDFLVDLACVVFLGAALVKAPALAILGLMVPSVRQALGRALEQAAAERKWWIALAICAPLAGYLIGHPAPPDDLLRDLTVWRHHDDYRPMYWGSPGISRGDYYLGFDWAAGWIDRAFVSLGQLRWAWLGVTIPLCIGTAAVMPAALLTRTRRRDPAAILLLCIVVCAAWMVPDFGQRVKSGRPEAFATLWMLSALLVGTRTRLIAWIACGAAIFSSYWFAWIYLPAFALLPRAVPWKARRWLAIALCLYAACFWLVASHGHILDWYWNLSRALHNRAYPVLQNVGLLAESFLPAAITFTALAITALWMGRSDSALQRHDGPSPRTIAWIVVWFLLPNMVRYVETVYALLAVLIFERLLAIVPEKIEPRILPAMAGAAFALCVVSAAAMFQGYGQIARGYVLPGAHPGDKVLTWFGHDTYDVLFVNPQVRVTPAFELGMTTKPLQKVSFALGKGEVSCQQLKDLQVRWVVAPHQANIERLARSSCLRLVGSAHQSSVWLNVGMGASTPLSHAPNTALSAQSKTTP